MNRLSNLYNRFTKFIKLSAIWVVRILFSKNHMKVPFYKRVHYAIFGGFMADQIALYKLNRKNKKEYLSEFDWYKSRYINEPYNFILNNKLVCTDLMKHYTKFAETYYLKKKGIINSYNGLKCSYEEIIKLLTQKNSLMIKPINLGKGFGVQKLDYKDKKFFVDNENKTKEEMLQYLEKHNNYFVSEYINQSKELNNIFKDATNTIRLITIRNPKTNKCEVLFAVQRIGTKETIPVDNGSRGGLVANIDIESGILSEARSIQRIVNFDKHPDNDNKIKGVKIKDWDKIKNHYVDLMEKFPYLYFVAWDILLTDNGPVVIEANTSSGVNIIQIWGGQRKGKLGEFYKHHNIIRK